MALRKRLLQINGDTRKVSSNELLIFLGQLMPQVFEEAGIFIYAEDGISEDISIAFLKVLKKEILDNGKTKKCIA